MMTNDQTYAENKTEFVARLLGTGWTKADAEKEWLEIQSDEEAGE